MLLFGEISTLGVLLIVAVTGCVAFKMLRRRQGEHRGVGLKVLGVAAIVAGMAVFWIRPGTREVHVDYAPAVPVEVGDIVVEQPVFRHPAHVEVVHHDGVPKWVLISLGSGLVILGALLFGRGGNRPVALKAVTLLGVGAILYSVATFIGHPTWHSRSHRDSRVVRLEARDVVATRDVRTERHTGRARRPSLRPERPTGDDERRREELPPRAGEIPVSAELKARASVAPAPESTPASTSEPAAAPAVAPEPAPVAAPQPPEAAAKPVEEPPAPPAAPAAGAPESTVSEPAAPATPPAEPAASAPETLPADPPKQAKTPRAAESARRPTIKPSDLPDTRPPDVALPKVVKSGDGPRPDWVDAPPALAGGVYSLPVRSGRFASLPDCQRELDREIKTAADHYIDEYLGPQAAALVNIPHSYLNQRVKKAEYVELVEPENLKDLNLGHMYEIYALLEFDEQARTDFDRQWRNAEVVHRLWYTGGAAALVLTLLATLYGYLKLDVRTGGAHKGRLQLAATLVALIAAAGVLLVRWAVPF